MHSSILLRKNPIPFMKEKVLVGKQVVMNVGRFRRGIKIGYS